MEGVGEDAVPAKGAIFQGLRLSRGAFWESEFGLSNRLWGQG